MKYDEMIEFWNASVIFLYDLHAPYKTVRITKPPAPWLTDNLKLMTKLKKKALAKYKKLKTLISFNEYKQLRNFVNYSIKMEKKLICSTNFKQIQKIFGKH